MQALPLRSQKLPVEQIPLHLLSLADSQGVVSGAHSQVLPKCTQVSPAGHMPKHCGADATFPQAKASSTSVVVVSQNVVVVVAIVVVTNTVVVVTGKVVVVEGNVVLVPEPTVVVVELVVVVVVSETQGQLSVTG